MKLQQMRYVCEVVERGLNLSRAAESLHTSQSGISRYIDLLERELGVKIFVRDKKRIAALSRVGKDVYAVSKRILNETANLRRLARDQISGDAGELTVATPQTHARYSLPAIVETFVAKHPRVRLRLREGNLRQISSWLSAGEADISIASAPSEPYADLVFIPCREMHRVVLTLPRHPLLRKPGLVLEDLARCPIITYDDDFAARSQILNEFTKKQLVPNIVLATASADTMKTYVRRGLGIAIVADVAYEKKYDSGLRCMDARHLFGSNVVHVGLRRNVHLPAYLLNFLSLFAPQVPAAAIRRAVHPSEAEPT